MFLFEGEGKAVLYTGDIRGTFPSASLMDGWMAEPVTAEDWWVEYIARHPVLLPYSTGVKRLDRIYLDTSCAAKEFDRFNPKVCRYISRNPTQQ